MIAALASLPRRPYTRALRTLLIALSIALLAAAGCDKSGDASDTPSAQESAPKDAPPADKPADKAASTSAAPAAEAHEAGPAIPGLAETTDNQQMLLLEAKKAFLTDDISRAEALFETLVKSKPASGAQVSAVIALAQIYNETGRPDEAVKLYDELSDAVSALPEIQLVTARAYADLNKPERAIKAYKKLLKAQPDYVFAQLELAQLYVQNGQNDEAGKAFYAYEQRIYKLAGRLESAKSSPEQRLEVLSVFSLVSDERASAATIKALKDDSEEVRRQADTVLGQMGAVEATAPLEALTMDDPSPLVRMSAQQALKEIRELGVDPDDASAGPTVVDDASQLPTD